MARWVKQCAEQHGHSGSTSTMLPARLLDLHVLEQHAVLCASNDATGRYAALSHCWGSAQTVTLNTSTFETLCRGIRVGHLPQTLKDAVWITGQLGIRYLWIDSLCILQDDTSDWIRESQRMGDIYSNSFVTIAACRAADGQAGFLDERPAQSHVPVPMYAAGRSGTALAFAVPHKYIAEPTRVIHMEDEPLTSRGWALQERYLSPRTLHFTKSIIFFECGQGIQTEDNCLLAQSAPHPSFALLDYSMDMAKNRCRQDWRKMVEQYSQRKLTVQDDKLPALGGLAARFSLASTQKDERIFPVASRYLAGLWFDDMVRDMCWSMQMFSPGGVRPPKYRAPTWSWASVDGSIDYKTSWVNSISELAVVQDAHVELATLGNAFGKVVDGWVCLKVLSLRPYKKANNKSLWVREDGVVFRIAVTWDAEPYDPPGQSGPTDSEINTIDMDLFVVPLGWVDRHLDDGPDALLGPLFLVLKVANHCMHSFAASAVFQRVGFGIGVWVQDENGGTDKLGLRRLIVERFAAAKKRGDLQSIIII